MTDESASSTLRAFEVVDMWQRMLHTSQLTPAPSPLWKASEPTTPPLAAWHDYLLHLQVRTEQHSINVFQYGIWNCASKWSISDHVLKAITLHYTDWLQVLCNEVPWHLSVGPSSTWVRQLLDHTESICVCTWPWVGSYFCWTASGCFTTLHHSDHQRKSPENNA